MTLRFPKAPNWKLACPHKECDYYVDVASDTGTGEAAAIVMDGHTQRRHAERYPSWYRGASS